jgi:hypothetical protein
MTKKIYQVQIALKGFKPKIWRRLLVQSDLLLTDFHKIIQISMGWTNSHSHQFIKNRTIYTVRMPDDKLWEEMNNVDYKKLRISDLLKNEKEEIVYEYDFGDRWEHDIILEKILPKDEKQNYPVCLAGRMNCPPEDSGGIRGYADMLKILLQPDHKSYDLYMERLGRKFDPDHFDKDDVNESLGTKDYGCIDMCN